MKKTYYRLLAAKLIQAFESRNMEGHYYDTKEEALQHCLSLLKEGDIISNGGSRTLWEIGFHDAIKTGGYQYLDPHTGSNARAREKVAHDALCADYYFMSSNAIAETGELVNIDGIGNRTAALMFGPKHVIIIAGMNKVMPTLEMAVARAKTYATRLCMLQFNRNYATFEELERAMQNAESHMVITSRSTFKGRIEIVLVGEELGA